jgi:hypothetical protein
MKIWEFRITKWRGSFGRENSDVPRGYIENDIVYASFNYLTWLGVNEIVGGAVG